MSFQHSGFQHDALQTGAADGGAPEAPVFRQPLSIRIASKVSRVAQSFLAVNLLVSTLAVVAPPVQPAQASFPAQMAKRSALAAQLPAAPVRFGLATLAQNPFTQEDWATPGRRLTAQHADQLQAIDRAPAVAAAPFAQDDWTNPVRRVAPQTGDLPQAIDRFAQSPAPISPNLWPNPASARRAAAPIMYRPTVDASTPPPPAQIPFSQADWLNPAQKPVRQSVVAVAPFDRTTETPAPFAQSQWPNPTGKRTTQQPSQLPAFDRAVVAAPTPFTHTVWLSPGVSRWRPTSDIQQPFDRGPAPFRQISWPNPVRRVAPTEYGQTAPMLYAAFIVVPEKPYGVTDWPNPTRARKSVVPYLYRPTVDPATLPPVQDPFRQVEWINPTQRHILPWSEVAPVFDRTPAPLAAPFAQADWGNPVTRAVRITAVGVPPFDRTSVGAPAPFKQTDWRNPWHQRRAVQLEQARWFDRTPAGPVPFTQRDWPNPVQQVAVQVTPQIPVFDRTVQPPGSSTLPFDKLHIGMRIGI